ncbi:MAG TPA: alpha-hydroxy acid oxidase [Candidatus Eisenbacteria bacterium]|nr:alpha-hydroxy acid oxidase [Candidatus Eisenbacteria bacterium]
MSQTQPPRWDSRIINIADLRDAAERRVPKVVFDYLEGGADGEVTLRENCRVFDDVIFRPRQAVKLRECKLATRVLNFDLSFPAILAPVGYSRLMHPGGEVAAAAAAGEAGTIYTLSTVSGHKLEDVRKASKGPVWYQLYLVGGREVAEAALERAKTAGFSALAVTVDTAVAGNRERDIRNGMKQLLGASVFSKLPFLLQFLERPRWLANYFLDGGRPELENVVVPGKGPMELVGVGDALARAVVTWEDFRWIREVWKGPMITKGVLSGDDARRAMDEGSVGVVVSNHGARQLDTVSSTLRALPEVVKAVGGQAEVLMDGGIRRGADIAKALCLGAKAVLIGRAYAYGMAAAGQPGVTRALQILREDFERTLRLLGCPSANALDSTYISVPHYWN